MGLINFFTKVQLPKEEISIKVSPSKQSEQNEETQRLHEKTQVLLERWKEN